MSLKFDLKNAFNSIRRCLFLELIALWVPQQLPSAWLYSASPYKVFSNEGVNISLEGRAQQGDHAVNYTFSMVAKFIDGRLSCLKFALKLFYVDALLLIGDLQSLSGAINIFKELIDWQINLSKRTLHCSNNEAYT